jgi:hypothetical protein
MTTYSVYHGGKLLGTGRSSGPHATWHEAAIAARESARMFGADQVICDDLDEYRQWWLGQWSRHPRRIEVLPPAPPDDPAPAPSEAQRTYQTAYVSAQPGRSKTSRAAARRTAREAVIAAHGPAWLDAQGNPRRTLPLSAEVA